MCALRVRFCVLLLSLDPDLLFLFYYLAKTVRDLLHILPCVSLKSRGRFIVRRPTTPTVPWFFTTPVTGFYELFVCRFRRICLFRSFGKDRQIHSCWLCVKLTPLYLLTFPRTQTGRRLHLYPSPVPISAQMVHARGLRDSSAADRLRGKKAVPTGSVAGESRGAQAVARLRAYYTTGQLLTMESFLPLC